MREKAVTHCVVQVVVAEIANGEIAEDDAREDNSILQPIASADDSVEHLLSVRPVVDVKVIVDRGELANSIE